MRRKRQENRSRGEPPGVHMHTRTETTQKTRIPENTRAYKVVHPIGNQDKVQKLNESWPKVRFTEKPLFLQLEWILAERTQHSSHSAMEGQELNMNPRETAGILNCTYLLLWNNNGLKWGINESKVFVFISPPSHLFPSSAGPRKVSLSFNRPRIWSRWNTVRYKM